MAKHAMFRSDNLAGTTLGKYLAHIRMKANMDNGSVVLLGDYEAGAREVRTYTTPEANSDLAKIAILGSEEVSTDKTFDTVSDFTNKQGTIARGYLLRDFDVFAVTEDALEGTKAVGNVVELKAGHKLNTVGSLTPSSTEVGKIEAIEMDGNVKWYVIRVK